MAGWCEWQQYVCNCPNLLAKSIFCPNRFGVEVRNIIIPTMLCFTRGEFAQTVSLVWRYNYSPHVVSHRGRTCPTTCCVLPVVGVEVQFLPNHMLCLTSGWCGGVLDVLLPFRLWPPAPGFPATQVVTLPPQIVYLIDCGYLYCDQVK